MARFSNATESGLYYERYCVSCGNDRDRECPVWGLHFIWNDEDDDEIIEILSFLIAEEDYNVCECQFYQIPINVTLDKAINMTLDDWHKLRWPPPVKQDSIDKLELWTEV